jgi:hypothetical protein
MRKEYGWDTTCPAMANYEALRYHYIVRYGPKLKKHAISFAMSSYFCTDRVTVTKIQLPHSNGPFSSYLVLIHNTPHNI